MHAIDPGGRGGIEFHSRQGQQEDVVVWEQPRADFGIDAHAEFKDQQRRVTGHEQNHRAGRPATAAQRSAPEKMPSIPILKTNAD